MRRRPIAALLLLVLTASGCVIVGRAAPVPPPPAAPPTAPSVAYAFQDFTFRMNDGDPEPSYFDARLLSSEILDVWEERGYVREGEHVDFDELPGGADYALTVSGSVHAHTSFWAELLNVLTLLTVPYSVTNDYDVVMTAIPAGGGDAYVARTHTVDRIWVGILLVVGIPFAERGHNEEVERMADALYAQLAAQGAFAVAEPVPPRQAEPVEPAEPDAAPDGS